MADEPTRGSGQLNAAIVDALVRLAQADFSVRLPRQEDRSPEDALAFLINGIAEELAALWEASQRHQEEQQRTVDMMSDGLLAMASGQFDWTAPRLGDGSPRDVLAFLINNAMQELAQLISIREQQATEVAMLRAVQTTERLAGMGTLAAGAAHELSSPLSAALLYLQEVRDALHAGAPPATLLPAVESALEGVEKATVLLDDLRVFTRAKPQPTRPILLGELVDSAVRLLHHEAKTRCEVVTDILPVAVMANEARLGQVFINLLKNAIQSIDPGDRRNQRVDIQTTLEEGIVTIEIRDTGCGMSEAVAERAFEAFFTTKGSTEGTGLGLPISLATVRELGGDITIRSQQGVGTTVRVTLPVVDATTVPATPSPGPHEELRTTRERATILVVDDDPILLGALGQVLRREYEVHSANSGERALEMLQALGRVDLVLCDVMMPQMTGIELYTRTQRDRPDLGDRFLFFSGGGVTEQARNFLEQLGDYLRKPVTQKQLLGAVRRRLEGRR